MTSTVTALTADVLASAGPDGEDLFAGVTMTESETEVITTTVTAGILNPYPQESASMVSALSID